jgi:hypothetical protein
VLSWRLSITMDAAFCIETLEDALARHGKPDIFSTDQGSQFTGAAFPGVLAGNGIALQEAFLDRACCHHAHRGLGGLHQTLLGQLSDAWASVQFCSGIDDGAARPRRLSAFLRRLHLPCMPVLWPFPRRAMSGVVPGDVGFDRQIHRRAI